MVKLRVVRSRGEVFDPRFFERDPRFWPIADAAQVFADYTDWPEPEAYGLAFRGRAAPVTFVSAPPKPRRRREPPVLDLDAMYDAQIVRGFVPTRPRCWHDFMNALVWATFPRSKQVLHARQHELIRAWIPPGAKNLPNARTRAQDALALVDEGGVLLLSAGGEVLAVPFGHALFEGIVFETPAMIARGAPLALEALPPRESAVAVADALLAERLRAPMTPEDLPRFPFSAT